MVVVLSLIHISHIAAGAKKVVISAPAGNDLKTIVYSVNEKTLTKDDQVISCLLYTSCNTSISDAEVEYEEKDGSFWHLLYPVKETGEMLELATTRPVTCLLYTSVCRYGA